MSVIIFTFLFLGGDNEPDNPGPNPSSSFMSGHANVRGLNIADKFDELVSIFHTFRISDTWLIYSISSDSFDIPGYCPIMRLDT